jgi:glycosyltransferase involved in cell wall biosynthesis
MPTNILYISYDGILEPLGQSQVLSYLEKLSKDRFFFLITFEKKEDKNNQQLVNDINLRIKKSKIKWYPLIYHKRPTALATFLDIFYATVLGYWLILRYKLKIIHSRSYVPSVAALILKKISNVKYIFDMRGLWADERIDGGIWNKSSYLYKISKRLEKEFLLNSDVVVCLTKKAVKEIKGFEYLKGKMPIFSVIPTCTDLELFTPILNSTDLKKIKNSFIVGYVGSVGVWYLFDEAIECFKLIKDIEPRSIFHIINKGDHSYIYDCLNNAGIDKNSVLVEEKDHKSVVDAMQLMNVGVFIIKPLYSKIASMPTKLGEFLGCGVPCLCNSGVGDMPEIVNNNKVGVVLKNFSKEEKIKSIDSLFDLILDPNTKYRCRETALRYFSLDEGVKKYNEIYFSLD